MANKKFDWINCEGLTLKGFFYDLAQNFARDLLRVFAALLLGIVAGASVCLYYGFPIAFALLGGLAVLGFVVLLAVGG